ncbi:MAG: helix-turn-helix transcriptional regulator [Bacilli bacterium]|nr:helix-turn-helix transcriptional regulator [Bacilli bacterium]
MNQEKFGSFIKQIRKQNNLTQKQLADKYNVTYQAVSKWENGKNMPDISLIKQMSKDFKISLEELFNGEFKENKKNILLPILLVVLVGIIIILIIMLNNKEDDFKFKTLSSTCENFNIVGNIAYNDKKTYIYISNIEYCGGDDIKLYKKIECILYESSNNMDIKISSFNYTEDKKISLEEFLKNVTFAIDDYKKTCKEYSKNSLFLSINAIDENNKITSYKIPLVLEKTCNN